MVALDVAANDYLCGLGFGLFLLRNFTVFSA
jgi:hypothetical protein